MSDLFFDRQTCNSARRPNQVTPTIHVYQGLKGKTSRGQFPV